MAKRPGFTIVELLITIVIVGILVGITTLSFASIVNKNKQKSLEGALIESASAIKYYSAANKQLPNDLQTAGANIDNLPDIDLTYMKWGSSGFCLKGTNGDQTLYMDNVLTKPSATGCASTRPIQEVTRANCPSIRTMVKDARDNHTYWIQKIGEQCWMTTNLAYAGGTDNGGTNQYNDVIDKGAGTPGTNTINGPDNSGSITYTEAKYYVSPNANPTTDPTEPSTSTNGMAQYGYLYNWCAAMGGQNTAACADADTPAPDPTINICPAGWRLPTGWREFVPLNNAVNEGKTNSDAGLLASPWLGQRSGYWYNHITYQGNSAGYWSSTQYSSSQASLLYYDSSNVFTASYDYKSKGRAVRCVAL